MPFPNLFFQFRRDIILFNIFKALRRRAILFVKSKFTPELIIPMQRNIKNFMLRVWKSSPDVCDLRISRIRSNDLQLCRVGLGYLKRENFMFGGKLSCLGWKSIESFVNE